LPAASSAVTVTLIATPAVAEAGALTSYWVADPAMTKTLPDVPVMSAVVVSVAVTVWLPAVFRVNWNIPVPFDRTESAGRLAAASELVKCTMPA
jgi:hypothetical protein